MIELPDDELDKLFRKSSEELDPTFEPNDWSELKKRLDAEDGITPGGWWRKWWPAGLVLLFLGGAIGSYVLVSNGDEKISKVDKVIDNQEIESGNLEGAQPNLKEKSITNAAEKDSVAYGEIEVARVNTSTHPDVPTARDKSLPRRLSKAGGVHLEPNRSVGKEGDGAFSAHTKAADVPSTGETSDQNATSSAGDQRRRKSRIAFVGDKGRGDGFLGTGNGNVVTLPSANNLVPGGNKQLATAGAEGSGKSESPDLKEMATQSIGEKALQGLRVDLVEPVAFKKQSLEQQTEVVVPEATASEVEPEVRIPAPFVAIRFGYSPDLSTVGLKNFSKPGSAFSIMGELAVVPRLYLQAGVVRSVKEYSAGGSDYTFSKYVTDIATPDNVDGTCKMFEIPVGFRFDVLRMERASLFAGTGMSSYYVQNEKYKYNYSQYVYGAKKGWEGSTGWFWLSHINASVGYEYKVAPRLSLLAEPYLRIPVKRVGYGKVNLTTTGVWISIRYVPVFR